MPRDNWLEEWEKQSIVDFYVRHPEDGYRRVCYMMLDANIVAVSATSVYRVLQNAGVIGRSKTKASKKGTGFHQPLKAHDHWHIDVSYINIKGTFYYLCTILDGYSRYIVNWEIGKCMKETDIEIILQKASEKYPNAKARVITDNGPQFISKDFKEYIRLKGMTHVRTSPFYPQSNGKVERWHKTLKHESIRPNSPISLQDAEEIVSKFVSYYNNIRLHSAIGYISPLDQLEGRQEEIFRSREVKLSQARDERKLKRSRLDVAEKERCIS